MGIPFIYLAVVTMAANAQPQQPLGVELTGHGIRGDLWPNAGPFSGEGGNPDIQYTNGLATLFLDEYPSRNLYAQTYYFDEGWQHVVAIEYGSMNLEHIFSGWPSSRPNYYSPRIEPCLVQSLAPNKASLTWRAEESVLGQHSWDVDIEKTFHFASNPGPGRSQVDITTWCRFKEVPWKGKMWHLFLGALYEKWSGSNRTVGGVNHRHAWISFMEASYVIGVIEPDIYFYGESSHGPGWLSVGRSDWTGTGIPGATIGSASNTPREQHPNGEGSINIPELRGKRWIFPFYFGEFDADGAPPWGDSAKVWIQMLEVRPEEAEVEDVQFALWNWSGTDHLVAWDWQWTIRYPVPGKANHLRSRVVIMDKPANFAPIVAEYNRFARDLGIPEATPPAGDWLDVDGS